MDEKYDSGNNMERDGLKYRIWHDMWNCPKHFADSINSKHPFIPIGDYSVYHYEAFLTPYFIVFKVEMKFDPKV